MRLAVVDMKQFVLLISETYCPRQVQLHNLEISSKDIKYKRE